MSNEAAPLLLYVEDEPLILELGVTALEDAGLRVVAFRSGSEAITALTDRPTDFKALITDIDLGPDIDGWLVAQHARELVAAMPIIYVSGGSSNDWASKGVQGSVMLVKPYAAAQLVVAVASAIGGGAPAN